MPINQEVMKNMKQTYGQKKGQDVYHASVSKGKIKEEADNTPEKMRIGGPVEQNKKMQLGVLNPEGVGKTKVHDVEQLKKGIATEKEHTDDEAVAKKIAIDHLNEDPEYYSKLAKSGVEGETADAQGKEIHQLAKTNPQAATNALIEKNIEQHGTEKEKQMLGMETRGE